MESGDDGIFKIFTLYFDGGTIQLMILTN